MRTHDNHPDTGDRNTGDSPRSQQTVNWVRSLPRWVAILGWSIGFTIVLFFELLATQTQAPGDTISEIVWWLIGIDKDVTWYFLLARWAVGGFLIWQLFHFFTKRV